MGETSIIGLHLFYKTFEKVHIVRNRVRTTFSQYKSYVDHVIMYLEFKESDKVYFKVSPMREVVRF